MKKKAIYSAPRSEDVSRFLPSLLCTSPGLGESEGIDYEDWTVPE